MKCYFRLRRERAGTLERHPLDNRPSGARLFEKDVREIRSLGANGTMTHREIGALFGVTGRNVTMILNNRSWRSLSADDS